MRSMPGCRTLGSHPRGQEAERRVPQSWMLGWKEEVHFCCARIVLGWEKEWFKAHQWEQRDTKQIPNNNGLWSLARDAAAGEEIHNRTEKLESGSTWKAIFIPGSSGKQIWSNPSLFTLTTKIKIGALV